MTRMSAFPRVQSAPAIPAILAARSLALLLALALIAISACASLPPRREVSPPSPPSTQTFWLLADTQLHNVAGESTRSRSSTIDRVAKVAIRPPTLDLWAEVILASILDKIQAAGEQPVFFLGDAANISCINEYERFLGVMQRVPWFGVLGNHDGFYMGNLTYLPDRPGSPTRPNAWSGACQHGVESNHELRKRMSALESAFLQHETATVGTHAQQGTLSKTTAAWMYLNHLKERGVIDEDPLDAATWKMENGMLVFRATGKYKLGGAEHSVDIVSAIPGCPRTAWKAYMLQAVTLPDSTRVLMVDTSDFLNLPTGARAVFQGRCGKSPNNNSAPGRCGEIGEHQALQIESMRKSWGKNARFFVLGHHPWQDLRYDATSRLDSLRRQPGFITYISGHTHFAAATVAPVNEEHWELNVASTTDSPREYVQVGFRFVTATTKPEVELDVTRHTVRWTANDGALAVCAAGDREKELQYGTPLKYLNRALDVYVALLGGLPADERKQFKNEDVAREIERAEEARRTPDLGKKRDAIAALMTFDRAVLRASLWVRSMEERCAVWASEIEGEKNGEGMLRRSIRLNARTPYRVRLPHP